MTTEAQKRRMPRLHRNDPVRRGSEVTTSEVLIAARAKVAAGWTQGAPGRDAAGNPADVMTQAVCWCAIGACYAAASENYLGEAEQAIFALKAVVPLNLISIFNDATDRTQADVLEVFDRAIARENVAHQEIRIGQGERRTEAAG